MAPVTVRSTSASFHPMISRRIALILAALASLPSPALAQYCSQRVAVATGQAASASFGASVALTPEFALVGDPYLDQITSPGPGLISSYTRHPIGGHLLLDAQFSSSDGMVGDRFGIDCDVDGQTMVVGADGHDQAGAEAGAAYVFERLQGQWVETQKIVSPITAAGDGFGGTVAVEGEWMVVSAPGSQDVFVYRKVGAVWTMYQVINFPNVSAGGSVEAEVAQGRIAAANRNSSGVFEFNAATQRWTLRFGVATASAFQFTGMAFDGDRMVVSRNYGLIEVYERNAATGSFGPSGSVTLPAPGAVAQTADRVLVMEPAAGFVRTFLKSGTQWGSAASAPGGMPGPGAIATDGQCALVSGVETPVLYDFDCGAVGVPECTQSALNSTGSVGSLQALGSDVLSHNQLELAATVLPDGAFGYFLASRTPGFAMGAGGAAGDLCLGGAIGRYVGAGQILNTGMAGGFQLAIDLTAMPTPTGPVSASVGETWYFQAWHRDANPLPGSNFTGSVSVLLR
ncbi:MAG: hypothetical protein ACI8WY_002090 [Planctomycetota bacterium]|jgi:hypothetical protein